MLFWIIFSAISMALNIVLGYLVIGFAKRAIKTEDKLNKIYDILDMRYEKLHKLTFRPVVAESDELKDIAKEFRKAPDYIAFAMNNLGLDKVEKVIEDLSGQNKEEKEK